jgi:hypothetical protein
MQSQAIATNRSLGYARRKSGIRKGYVYHSKNVELWQHNATESHDEGSRTVIEILSLLNRLQAKDNVQNNCCGISGPLSKRIKEYLCERVLRTIMVIMMMRRRGKSFIIVFVTK